MHTRRARAIHEEWVTHIEGVKVDLAAHIAIGIAGKQVAGVLQHWCNCQHALLKRLVRHSLC